MVMLSDPRAKVTIEIDGKEHGDWQNYMIESEFLTPADAFDMSIGMPNGIMPPDIDEGVDCVVKIDGHTILTGILDTIRHDIDKYNHTYALNGRDRTSLLVDCSAPITNFKGLSLLEAIKKIAEPLGIKKVELRGKNPDFDKTDIEPGMSAWDTIIRLANSAGLHAWSDPEGTLIIGAADYTTEPVAKLTLNRNGKNNIIRMDHERSSANRYSEVIFLGQTHGKKSDDAKNKLKYVHKDESAKFTKKKTVVLGDIENYAALEKAAKKYLSDMQLAGETLTVTVAGHFTDDKKTTPFMNGQRVHIESDIFGIDAVYFLMGCRYSGSKFDGTTTSLTFKEDGIWLPESKGAGRNKNNKKKKADNREKVVVDVKGYDEW